ncbi:Crp/Fnr family transcriptional regulator [Sphingorhabdus arenilitoris]|uniref:Crp/Fnr family transcriptional regulator n=1 Tax=Sphingorhabdus arenilitoris TaxID=1490041 RepID=A0ABV8RGE8_9SPHN
MEHVSENGRQKMQLAENSRRLFGIKQAIRCTSLKFHAGQMIFEEGQRANRWYEVLHGTVRTCRFHIDGSRHLTGFYFAGDVFGADYGQYGAAAEAVTDVDVLCYRVGDFSSGPGAPPPEDGKLSILFRAINCAQRYQYIMGHRTAHERLAAFLLCLKQQEGRSSFIRLPMSRSDIADFLGLTIHTVSRTFTELARRELIKIDGRNGVFILDHRGLCDLAGEEDGGVPPAIGGDSDDYPGALSAA